MRELYRPRFLLYPFTDVVAFAVAAIAVAASQVQYGRMLYLLVPPSMLLPIVRGFGAGREQSVVVGGARQLLVDWWRTLAVTGVVFFPVPLWMFSAALADDVPVLDSVANLILQLSVFVLPILAAFYPGHLAALAVENDVLRALLPGLVAKVRTEKMEQGASAALVILVVLGGFFGVIFTAMFSSYVPSWGGIVSRAFWVMFAFQVAILVGLSLQGRVGKKILLGNRPEHGL